MDDCSPDDTEVVARSFRDDRVRHIRNEPNLGHLKNYNKGIELARGDYVWLISADDFLRSRSILERYVKLMDADGQIGYVFCPAIGVKDGRETGVCDYSLCGDQNWVRSGALFLEQLIYQNIVPAASGMVRREYYQNISLFPLSREMAWMGDWYLWCLFALHGKVGYFAEPMVCYREHDQSMTRLLSQGDVQNMRAGDIALPWLIKKQAENMGFSKLASLCPRAIAVEYARHLVGKQYQAGGMSVMTEAEFESLSGFSDKERERSWIRARTYAQAGDRAFAAGDIVGARSYYQKAVRYGSRYIKVQLKRLLLSCGKPGEWARRKLRR